jgi:hypothetical protein
MMVMGREGYAACAKAVAEVQMQYINASAMVQRIIMGVFPFCFFSDSCFMGRARLRPELHGLGARIDTVAIQISPYRRADEFRSSGEDRKRLVSVKTLRSSGADICSSDTVARRKPGPLLSGWCAVAPSNSLAADA